MFESMPRVGALVKLIALAGVAAAVGCAATEGPAGGRASGGSADDLTASVPPAPSPFQCGGLTDASCPSAGAERPPYTCVDDFRDECDPANGGADCSGLCVSKTPRACGGPSDLPCGASEVCVDDPHVACVAGDDVSACSTGVCARAACNNSDMPCGDTPTCFEGQLYPTTCGPANCDAPIGPCSPWDECGPPPPCPAPPLECHYEGGGCTDGWWTCGTLVCGELPEAPEPP
jgi:hypothetical protein